MLRTINFTGKLRQFSKKPVQIEADTTQMMMQGLILMFGPRFRQMIRDGEWHLTRNMKLKDVKSYDDTISHEELAFNLGKTVEIWLCPAMKAKSAVARIVVGVILIVVGVFTTWFGGAGIYAIQAGISLILGGVVELLTPKPKIGQQNQAGQNPSFMFNGTVNVTEQGGAVPIVYGRVPRASSLVLSAGMTTENMTIARGATGFKKVIEGVTNAQQA